MKDSICEIVRKAEDNYLHGSVEQGKYIEWDMHETIETIDAYLNSKHTSGSTDSLGREKPFFNIVTAATNIWYRATDIDRRNIRFIPDSHENVLVSYVLNVLLQNWMKKSRFNVFLNDWGRALARYGSAVCKFVEKDGQLTASVVPWNRLIVDPFDFNALPRIEKFYKTPDQLRKMEHYDQDAIEALITARMSRETLDGHGKDNQNEFIELYEVHGEMPIALLEAEPEKAEDSKWTIYRQQMHVVSFMMNKNGSYEDYTLFKGKEKKDPYMITHLIQEEGRTLSIGAVEYLFDAQWMKNHTIKNMKDTLDLASKLIFQTSDGNYIGRNVLSAIETGDILIHAVNQPLTQINNSKADVAAFQNFGAEWERMAQTITSTPDAIRGVTLPSGTPYSLGAYLGEQANSLFEIMTENKGNHIEDMMREFVVPFLKTQMDTTDEIVGILDANSIEEIDAIYVPRKATERFNREAVQKAIAFLEGDETQMPSPYQKDVEEQRVREQLSELGNKRFFKPSELPDKTWKECLDGIEQEVIVEVTNENTDKQAVLQTLSALFQTLAGNPAVLQDPNAKMLFTQILTETGRISPIQLSTASATPSVAPPTGGTEGLTALTQK